MDHFAGLDVSVKETSVCIVDDTGKIVREVRVASEPEALLAVLASPAYHFKWGSALIAAQKSRTADVADGSWPFQNAVPAWAVARRIAFSALTMLGSRPLAAECP